MKEILKYENIKVAQLTVTESLYDTLIADELFMDDAVEFGDNGILKPINKYGKYANVEVDHAHATAIATSCTYMLIISA